MLRTIKITTVVLCVITVAAFFGLRYYKSNVQDNVAPRIQADSQVLEISVTADESELLKGITASDDRDGDLTSQVIVQSVSQLMSADTATVTYLVFDSSNNMGTLKRTIRYTDYEHPRFTVSEALFYRPNDSIVVTDRIGCKDKSKDYTDQVRIVSHNVNSKTEGRYEVTLQVMNDMGDYVSVTLPLVVSDDYGRVQLITLKEYLKYYSEGEDVAFQPEKLIRSVTHKNGTAASPSAVQIESNVDLKTAGTYCVSYTYEDCTVYLTVVVEKEGL